MTPLLIPWEHAPTGDLMEMVTAHQAWGANPMGSTLVDFADWACPALHQFMQHAIGILNGLPGQGTMMLYSVVTPPGRAAGGWAHGYPHTHAYANYTLIHYLQPGDAFAPLVVFEGREKWVITPEMGLTVVFEGFQEHGILDSAGQQPRVALVLQSVPAYVQVH